MRSGKEVEARLPAQDTQVSTSISEPKHSEKKSGGETGNIASSSLFPDVEKNVDIGSLPYPTQLRKEKHDKNYLRFLDMFKNLHVNIPFAEVLLNMPNYAKFMKEILSKKRKLWE